MSIIAVITEHSPVSTLAEWAYKLAVASHTDLLVLDVRQSSKAEPPLVYDLRSEQANELQGSVASAVAAALLSHPEPEGEELKIVFKKLRVQDPLAAVLAEIAAGTADYLIVGKDKSSFIAGQHKTLQQQLFETAPCHTLVIRPGGSEFRAAPRILVPASGGPHSIVALELAHQITKQFGGNLTALMVEPDAGTDAEGLGRHMLTKVCKRAGIAEEPSVEKLVVLNDSVDNAIATEAAKGFDLVLLGASNSGYIRRALMSTVPERLMRGKMATSVAVVRSSQPLLERLRTQLEKWLDLTVPQLERDDRIALFEKLQAGSEWNFDFLALISLSTAIASMGLLQDSTAVVIGAMLVAPLMTPLLGAGLALVQGNFPLMRTSAKAIAFGFLTAIAIAAFLGLIVPLPELTTELRARGGPTLLDMAVALLSGIAAAHCTARPGLSAALPGVAIAAALVPPIATTGVCLATGRTLTAQGAAMLFGTNVVAIMLGAALTFFAAGVRGKPTITTGHAWVRRTTLGLILIAAALAVPLGSVLVSQVAQKKSLLNPIPEQLLGKLQSEISRSGATLISVHEDASNLQQIVELKIRSERTPSKQTVETLATILYPHLGPRGKVRVLTDLMVEQATRQPVAAPPKPDPPPE